jgi:hypothetical protein
MLISGRVLVVISFHFFFFISRLTRNELTYRHFAFLSVIVRDSIIGFIFEFMIYKYKKLSRLMVNMLSDPRQNVPFSH